MLIGSAASVAAARPLSLLVSAVPGCFVVAAPAKVNLFLEILGKRADQYHELETLILAVNLFDTLEIQAEPRTGPLAVRCEPVTIPQDGRNLVWKAAEALRQSAGIDFTATMYLSKRIPHEAGLGGGSSDAALTLLVLNKLWGLNYTRQQLNSIAATIGSDLGAFLHLPASWCTGRGEVVEQASIGAELHLVIVKPPLGLSTAMVYRGVQIPASPISGLAAREALRSGDPIAIAKTLHNRLQAPAFAASSVVARVYEQLQACQPLGVLLSGSGSCLFALTTGAAHAKQVADRFRQSGSSNCSVFVVRSLGPMASSIDVPQ